MDSNEIRKAIAYITTEIVDYIAHSVESKTILKKSTGNIKVMSFDTGEGISEKTSPFDTYAQIIEGKAELVISGVSHILAAGQSIVIPAHAPIYVTPNGRFKMILTVIKSSYE